MPNYWVEPLSLRFHGGQPFPFVDPTSLVNLEAWYDASQITGMADGQAVATWNDSSGNVRHLTQATASLRPIYKTGILNGLPVVRGDGTDDYISSATFTLSQPNTVFAVAKERNNTSTQRHIFDSPAAARNVIFHEGTPIWAAYGGGTITSVVTPDTSFHVFTALFNGASSELWLDSVFIASGNVGADAIGGIRLFASVTPGEYWDGDIAEVIVYNRNLSAAERALVETYLNSKWGL